MVTLNLFKQQCNRRGQHCRRKGDNQPCCNDGVCASGLCKDVSQYVVVNNKVKFPTSEIFFMPYSSHVLITDNLVILLEIPAHVVVGLNAYGLR